MAAAQTMAAAAATASGGRLAPPLPGPPQAAPPRLGVAVSLQSSRRAGPSLVAGAASGDRMHSGSKGKLNGRRAPESMAAAACEEAATSTLGALPRLAPARPVVPGAFSQIPEALEAVARGEAVVVLDDEDRENEGDLIFAAELATAELLAFTVRHTSGVICVGMAGADLDRLEIPLMVEDKENEDAMMTAFTVTVDARQGTSTGISASDRAVTIRALASPESVPQTFNKPGHIFPLRCREGGVLRRPGHTEASVDLARLAGCSPAGVLCEIVNDDGTMARTPDLLEFGALHGLHVITIKDLVHYIQQQEAT